MKNLVTIVIWLGVVSIGFSQKIKGDEVPQVVSTAFAKVYSNVKNLKWEKEGEGFEASFDNQKEEMSVLLDATGKIKEVETEIELSALPVAVKNSLAKDFADYKIKEAAKIVSENVTTYEAEGKKGKESFDFLFSEDGKLIKKVDTKKKVKNQS